MKHKKRTGEVFAIVTVPVGGEPKVMARCGGKTIDLELIDTFQQAKGNDGPPATVVHYEGSDGRPLSWVFFVPYEDVWDEFCRVGELLSKRLAG